MGLLLIRGSSALVRTTEGSAGVVETIEVTADRLDRRERCALVVDTVQHRASRGLLDCAYVRSPEARRR